MVAHIGLDRVCDTPSQACLRRFHLPLLSPPVTTYIRSGEQLAHEVHPARRRGLNRRERSEVCRGIYRRHCSSTQEGHFRTLGLVPNTLLHTTLGTTSVTLLNTPSDTPLLVSFFSACHDARYCAIAVPSVTTFCEALYAPQFIPGK